jgi:broad specificity phosphatase PhoE
MGILLLVRHGQASIDAADYDQLSAVGRRQARSVGERLAHADLSVERILCGTSARQRDTAGELVSALGFPEAHLRTDARLDEFDHVGLLAAHPYARTVAAWPEGTEPGVPAALDEAIARWIAADQHDQPVDEVAYPESHVSFVARAVDAVRALTDAAGTSLAVTSAGVIAAVSAAALGLPAERWPSLAGRMVNSSITRMASSEAGGVLMTFNDYAHLEHDRMLITYR